MGDAADDAWEVAFRQQCQEDDAVRALRRDCEHDTCPTPFWDDDGLIQCPRCGRTTDV